MIRGDEFSASYGCGPLDFSCLVQEAFANVVGGVIKNLGDFMADMFAEAFKNTGVSETDWSVASAQFWFWIKVMSVVLLAVGALQMIAPVILADLRRLLQVGVGYILAVPTAVFAVIVMQRLVSYGDLVTNDLTASMQGQSMAEALMRIFGWTLAPDGSVHIAKDADAWGAFVLGAPGGAATSALGAWLITLVILVVVALGAVFLQLSMAIRDFGLLALAATAPIAWMMIGQPKLAVWAGRWATLTIGLLFAKPLAAAILTLAVSTFGNTTTFATQLVAAAAVFIAAFSPAWAVGLVAVTSAEARSALPNRPSVTTMITKFNVGAGAGARLMRRR